VLQQCNKVAPLGKKISLAKLVQLATFTAKRAQNTRTQAKIQPWQPDQQKGLQPMSLPLVRTEAAKSWLGTR